MTPLILAVAFVLLAPDVKGVTVPGHRPPKFDDTQMNIINNGGDPNQLLCAERPIVGSRFTRHICYTRAEWSDLKSIQQYHTSRMMRRLGEQSGGGAAESGQANPPGANNPQ